MLRLGPIVIATLALAVLLGEPSPVAVHAGPPVQATIVPIVTLPPDEKTIRAAVDLALAEHLLKLQTFEASYKGDGRANYFQTLISHSTIPADGQATPPDKLAAGPTDQAEKLTDFWTDAQLAPALPYAFRTDVYDGPEGAGYVLSAQVMIAGELWEQSVNVGPERWRESAWQVVVIEK